ncbi:DUF3187 family protein [Motilimonas pumila]|nr:DUF3187 family protein [Motilimonas pumila]
MNTRPFIRLSQYLAVTALSAMSGLAQANLMPLRTYAASPYQSLSFTPQLRSAFHDQGHEVFAGIAAGSVWAQSAEFELDYYQNQAFVGVNYQINDKLSAEVMYRYAWAGDNKLDGLTKDFHDLVGMGQNGRDEVSDHRFSMASHAYGMELPDFENDTMSSEFHGYLQYQLYASERHAWAIGGSLYYNDVPSGTFKRSSFEQGVQLNYSFRHRAHGVFSSLGYSHRNDGAIVFDAPINKHSWSFAAGYGYQFNERHGVILQYHVYEGVLDDNSAFGDATQEVVAGYRYRRNQFALELSMTENIVNMDNSTDIYFATTLRYFWD